MIYLVETISPNASKNKIGAWKQVVANNATVIKINSCLQNSMVYSCLKIFMNKSQKPSTKYLCNSTEGQFNTGFPKYRVVLIIGRILRLYLNN